MTPPTPRVTHLPTPPLGETNLARLLHGMRPALDPERWAFCTLPGDAPPSPSLGAAVTVHEAEGWTAVVPTSAAERAGLPYDGAYRRVTLTVHSSLAAVGLTAAVSRVLADVGVPCNVVAGFYHDHLFVPEARVHAALDALARLADGSGTD